MRSRVARTAAGLATVLAASGAVAALPIAAQAGTAPPWETGNANAVGTITFYDASGNQVTSGSVSDKPIAAFAVGSAFPRAGDAKAALFGEQPAPNTDPALFSGDQLSSYTSYPVASGPSAVMNATGPVVTGASGDLSLGDFVDEYPNSGPGGPGCRYETSSNPATCTNTGYEDSYQIRLYTADSSGTRSTSYDVADVQVVNATYNNSGQITGGTWQEVYPVGSSNAVSTQTVVGASPKSPVTQGTSVTLGASVSASDSTKPAGKVQFKVNSKNFGSPVTVSTAGSTSIATLRTTALPVGTDTISATFIPSDQTAYQNSSSASIRYTVNAKALRNTAKPRLSGTGKVGSTEKCSKGSWAPAASTYHYQWLLNGKAIKHATKSSYKIPSKDKGKKLSCRVTAERSGYKSARATGNTIRVKP